MRYILHVLCIHVHVYNGGLNNNIQLKHMGFARIINGYQYITFKIHSALDLDPSQEKRN